MMSIDHQKNHFKRPRDEIEEIEEDNGKNIITNAIHAIKKRKVDISSASDDSQNDFQSNMYSSYLKSALEALEEDNSIQLDTLANQISLPQKNPEAISTENFITILKILTNSISKLDSSKCNNLILSIINYHKWWNLNESQIAVFKKFIVTLCSYSPKWWNEVSNLLISNFTLSLKKTSYHHQLLRTFIKIIPTSIYNIRKILVAKFPNKNGGKNENLNYVSNLLKLNDYCFELRFNVWTLIVERCIQIDVELQNELDELDEEDYEDDEDGDEDDDKVHSEDEDDEDDEDGAEEDENADEDESFIDGEELHDLDLLSRNISDLSEKLDSILYLVFTKLADLKFNNDEDEEKGIILYNTLISLFKSHILPTYFTKSTQFILFYFTQQSPQLMDSFLVTLIDLSFSTELAIEKRVKSLQYLSSYISRASKLTANQILFVTSYLISWLNKYVEEREVEINKNTNMDRFRLYYSTFQVLLYIFCFRHSILRTTDDEWELSLDKFFQRMLITKFNPLKYCNESVVLMFAKIAQEENLAYCFSIIEKNKNEKLKGIVGNVDGDHGDYNNSNNLQKFSLRQQFIDLEAYFPFDPLFLKKSKDLLKDFYIEWSSISKDYESDSDDLDDLTNEVVKIKAEDEEQEDEDEENDEDEDDAE